MEDEGFRTQLDRIRERIRQDEESTSVLTNLFQDKKEDLRRTNLRKFSASVRELEKDKRITGAVAAQLDILPQKVIDDVESSNPHTASALFKISRKIIKGEYGPAMQLLGQALSEKVLNWETLAGALILNECALQTRPTPEILEGIRKQPLFAEFEVLAGGIKEADFSKILLKERLVSRQSYQHCRACIHQLIATMDIPAVHKKIFVRIFKNYLDNYANPSSVGVGMMLEREESVQRTFRAAMKLKNREERAKSVNSIVDKLLGANKVDRAFEMISSLKRKKDVARSLTHLVDQLLGPRGSNTIENSQVDQALEMADNLKNQEKKHRILQRLASGLARHGKTDKAMAAVAKIQDSEKKDYAFSTMVNSLVGRGDFSGAAELAAKIEDAGFREDAHSYIVRGLLEKKSFRDVLAFVESIEDSFERTQAAKIILSSVRSSHDPGKVEEVCKRFELVSK